MKTDSARVSLSFDRILSSAFFVLAAVVLWETRDLEYWGTSGPGPRFFPTWIAIGVAITSLVVFIRRPRPLEDSNLAGRQVGTYALLMGLAVFSWSHLGTLATFGLFAIFELFVVERYPPLRAIVIGFAITAVFYLIFVVALQMRLPQFGL